MDAQPHPSLQRKEGREGGREGGRKEGRREGRKTQLNLAFKSNYLF
jgi:hypothetical protein